ncbi:DUF2207 domain-containing protein [Rhodanobacter sp. AS-Z3]|uniref:DUF2207 family protein n=1 Tax=Rhodanobacter sp. AS-Z3 TaxID=3031330 RepID=UPI002479C21C|nr:DUF2207 domain-containing protein [Rhodanobacter sp. AS-Z3]WEN14277.1 DUF2207 domain-containing protein [Rhodanobacter sp. AS-Z3]
MHRQPRRIARLFCLFAMLLVTTGAMAQDASPPDTQPALVSRNTEIQVGYGHAIDVDETTWVNAAVAAEFHRELIFPGRKLNPVDVPSVGASENDEVVNADVVPWGDGLSIRVHPKRQIMPRKFEIYFRILHGVAVGDDGRLVWPLTLASDRLPLQHAHLQVSLPAETPTDQIHAHLELDGVPVEDGTFQLSGTRVSLDWPGAVAPGQVLDAVVTFPRVSEPWGFDPPKAPAWMFNGPLWLVLLALYYFVAKIIVSGVGDGKPVIVEYEPPAGWSAGAVRLLWHGSWDRQCFATGVLGIAAKGGLTLGQQADGSWTATRAGDDTMPSLTADERSLRAALFTFGCITPLSDASTDSIGLAEMAFRRVLEARCASERPMDPALLLFPGWFIALPAATLLFFGIASRFATIAEIVVVSFLCALGLAMLRGAVSLNVLRATRAQFLFVGLICVAGLLGGGDWLDRLMGVALLAGQVAGSWWLVRQSPNDTALLRTLRGFRWYLGTAEQQEMDARYKPSLHPELQASLLPYAMALDVEVTWNAHFAQALVKAEGPTDFLASMNPEHEQASLDLLAYAQSIKQQIGSDELSDEGS